MPEEEKDGTIYTVRIIVGREKMAAEMIRSHARTGDYPVHSIVIPEIKGYIFVEADGLGPVKRAVEGVKPVKSVMSDPATLDELEGIPELGRKTTGIAEGDRVEIIEGGLKGEEGEVIEVNPERGEIVVEVDDPDLLAPLTINVEEVERK